MRDPGTQDRIEDDKTRHPYGRDESTPPGSTLPSGTLQELGGYTGRGPNDRLSQMEAEYDRLGQPAAPLSLKQKLLRGLLTGVGGFGNPQFGQQMMRHREFEQSQLGQRRDNLLREIEAERRLQEQTRADDLRAERADLGKTVTLGDKVMQWDPATQRYDIEVGGMGAKPDANLGKTVTLGDQVKQWNPDTQRYDIPVGQAKPEKPDTIEQQYTDEFQRRNPGSTLAEAIRAYAADTQKPERDKGDVGSWQLQEDEKGQPVLFNSKTGQTKAAPANLRAKGTFQKTLGPAEDAQNYANQYIDSKAYTGPGDEALMEKFFELARPSSGFRMTQAQVDMLKNAQSWKNSVAAIARHAYVGTWYSDDQRRQIVDTMNSLAAAKLKGSGRQSGAQGGGGNGLQVTDPRGHVHTFRDQASANAFKKAAGIQ
jgi:hypothetical protein